MVMTPCLAQETTLAQLFLESDSILILSLDEDFMYY